MGPGAGQASWEKVFCKAMKKVMLWREVGCSLYCTTLLYNIYILPTLSFVAQLLNVPDTWEKVEDTFCRKLIRGPAKWASPKDFRQLKRSFHFPAEFRCLRLTAKAAKFRIEANEAARYGGTRSAERWRRIDMCIRAGSSPSCLCI